jgi:D-glycero-alpha-D-manno-heptose-7-phosphate kinase
MQLAEEACEVEIERCGKRIGKQDHYIAALGGLQYIKFYSNGSVHSHPVICRYQTKKDLESQLLLVYTNKTRSSSLVLDEQSKNFDTNESAIQSAKKLRCLANTAQVHLTYNTLRTFGLLLNKAWELKKDLASKITDDGINHMYVRALEDGALGGKLLGAGGGGFLLLFAPPEKHKDILPELRHVPFKLEPQGSKIIYIEE